MPVFRYTPDFNSCVIDRRVKSGRVTYLLCADTSACELFCQEEGGGCQSARVLCFHLSVLMSVGKAVY